MDQDIIKPHSEPKAGRQAFSPLGCLVAAAGATLLVFAKAGAVMVTAVWALSQMLGLPDVVMYVLMVAGAVPVLWATAWTAGRAWHVERLLAQGRDIDIPVFRLAHYLRRN
jgi:hypothetical protein